MEELSSREINSELWDIESSLRTVRAELSIYDSAKAAGRPVPPSFSSRFEPNARKRTLRAFNSDEVAYKEDIMLRHVKELRVHERQLRALHFRIRDRMLWRQRGAVIGALQGIGGQVQRARREFDAAVDEEKAARSRTLPRAMGGRRFAKQMRK